jgi:hypothetical protein
MPKLQLFKMTRDTSYFVKGQKVWEVYSSGDLSYQCIGRFRGHGRWVMGWVHCDVPDEYTWHHNNPDCRWLGEVEVSDEFYDYYHKIRCKIVKNEFAFTHGI